MTLADFWRRFQRNKPALVGLIIIAVFVLISAAAPLLTPYDAYNQNLADAFIHPGTKHLLGTDFLGRDVLARLLFGGRLSLTIGVFAVGLGLVVGVPLGVISAFYGRWVDMLIQRVTDVLLSFPGVLLALALVAVLGVGVRNVIIAVGISTIPRFIRIARSAVFTIREMDFVEAAEALGASNAAIMARHIMSNIWAPIIVQATISIGFTILSAAGLGFLGLGVQAPQAEWGTMLGNGRQYIFSAPYLETFPGIAIFLAVLAFNLIGDGLRDALDPHEVD